MSKRRDNLHRETMYMNRAVENPDLAAAVEANYERLSPLMSDSFGMDVFQTAYCRMTERYRGGDVVTLFTDVFYSTRRELGLERSGYRGGVSGYDDRIGYAVFGESEEAPEVGEDPE